MKVLIMKFTNKKDRVTEAVVIAHVTFPRWPVMRHEVFNFYFFCCQNEVFCSETNYWNFVDFLFILSSTFRTCVFLGLLEIDWWLTLTNGKPKVVKCISSKILEMD